MKLGSGFSSCWVLSGSQELTLQIQSWVPVWLSWLSVSLGSGYDPWVLGSSLMSGSLLSGESVSPSAPPPAGALSLSLKNK